jgi:transcriptional regulator with XRE-family HTH domain
MPIKKTCNNVSLKNLSKNLRKLFKQSDMVQKDFASTIGITQGFLSEILNCKGSVSIKNLDTIAEKIGTTSSKLIDEPKKFDIRDSLSFSKK